MGLFGNKKKTVVEAQAKEPKEARQQFFENFESAHKWKAQFSQIFICTNNEDNLPVETILTKSDKEEYTFMISQNRSSYKKFGQDCMCMAKHNDWEIQILCDGHDEQGHFMSQGVCRTLPNILLRKIHDRFPDEIPDPVDDDLIYDAFDECEKVVCWTSTNVVNGDFCTIQTGDYAGMQGYVTGFKGLSTAIVSVLEEVGNDGGPNTMSFRKVEVNEQDLLIPRYVGGCTCIVLIRNMKTNEARMAIAGDSRACLYMPGATLVDPALIPVDGMKKAKGEAPVAYMTPQHNVYNMEEIARLNEEYSGLFTIQGSFLVNPETNFAIQPTRGFGDHDMHGTGYTHMPELTDTFILDENTLIVLASDGVFDDKVWQDDEIVTRIAELYDKGEKANEIAKQMYDETLERSLDGGYVDDISICVYSIPHMEEDRGEREQRISVVEDLNPSLARSASKRSVTDRSTLNKNRRQTLRRGKDHKLQSLIDSEEGEEGEDAEQKGGTEEVEEGARVAHDPTMKVATTPLKDGGSKGRGKGKTLIKNKNNKKNVFSLKKFQKKERSNWQSKSVKKITKKPKV